MLLDLAQLIVREAERLQTRDIVVASFVAVPILLLLLWRLWTFTIFPSLRPREPRTIPYWIPSEHDARPKLPSFCEDSMLTF